MTYRILSEPDINKRVEYWKKYTDENNSIKNIINLGTLSTDTEDLDKKKNELKGFISK
jgi:hypothetical protein